jgi:hypothetical protein
MLVPVALVVMAVTVQLHLFQQKEKQQTAEQGQKQVLGCPPGSRTPPAEHAAKRVAQQHPGGQD